MRRLPGHPTLERPDLVGPHPGQDGRHLAAEAPLQEEVEELEEGRQGLLQCADHVVEARGLPWQPLTLVPVTKTVRTG